MVSNYKFVDDKTLAHTYSEDPSEFLQMVLNFKATETAKNKMVINESKCNIITFTFSSKNTDPNNLLLYGNTLKTVDIIPLVWLL